ncbi:hypothetical protein [Mycolicibacterium sp. GESEQ-9]|uniref:hypothetical protein n=1 Tax=Mycolicibacterium sp. GESEQ-9 TaxID=2812656 RepID=UPI001B328B16|nr:hypothetical protein [Mycolicibacterium sp. GESEQ-9]
MARFITSPPHPSTRAQVGRQRTPAVSTTTDTFTAAPPVAGRQITAAASAQCDRGSLGYKVAVG